LVTLYSCRRGQGRTEGEGRKRSYDLSGTAVHDHVAHLARRHRSKIAAVLGTVLLMAGLMAGCGDRHSSPAAGTFTPISAGVLTVATTEIPSAGFWLGSPDDLTGGFEYGLAQSMAQRFGLEHLRIVLEPFDQIVSGHLGSADLALDLITPTKQRGKLLTFSTPYLQAPPTVVVRSGTDVPDLATAQTLRWGAVKGTTFVDIVNDLIAPGIPETTFDNNAEMLAALTGKTIDAAVQDMPLAVVTAEQSDGRLATAAQLPGSETIAAGLPKGSHNVEAVDSAIRAFISDGTIDDLLRRWIGPSAVNAAKEIPLLRTTR
jgi:polar amino acid transport system substrate-binding protein